MKLLCKLVKKNRIWVILSLLFSFFGVGAQLVWTKHIGTLMDLIAQREKIEIGFLVIMGGWLVASTVTQYFNQLVNRYTAERMGHTLRMGFADRIFSRDNDGQGITSGYEAVTKVQNELTQASEYMSNTLFDVVSMTLSAFFILIFLFMQNVLLTLSLLIPILLVMLIVQFNGRQLAPLVNKSMEGRTRHNKVGYSLISNFEAVRVFDGGDFYNARYCEELDAWGRAEIRLERVSAVCNSLTGALSQVPLLLLLSVGTLLIWNGSITLGTLIIFLNMQKSVLRTLMNLTSWMLSVKGFLVHLNRVDIGG